MNPLEAETRLEPAAHEPSGTKVPDGMLLILAILALWELSHLALGASTLPSPWRTLRKVMALTSDPDFRDSVAVTGLAFLWALLISVLGGLGIGVFLGARRLAGEVAEPILIALYSIPKITLYPVILLMFGLGISAKIAFGAIHGIIPVVIVTMAAVRNIRPVLIRTARSMGLSSRDALIHVLVPATLPEIISGLRIGFALTLLGTLIGEMFASKSGIGFMLMHAIDGVETTQIMALALLLFIFATVVNFGLLALEKWLYH